MPDPYDPNDPLDVAIRQVTAEVVAAERARCADVVRDGQTDDSTYDEMIAVIEGSTDAN